GHCAGVVELGPPAPLLGHAGGACRRPGPRRGRAVAQPAGSHPPRRAYGRGGSDGDRRRLRWEALRRHIVRSQVKLIMKASLPPEPTHARRSLLGLVFALAVITYLDRLCISAAMPWMAAEFNLTPDQKGWIFSAFTLAYAAFEIPSGWLGDRFGARRALTRIVLWWSAFTMLTSAAFGFWSLLAIRFLFGAGEAGAFPNIARAVSRWFPEREQ